MQNNNITEISLKAQNLTSIPEEVFELESLEILKLNDNQIRIGVLEEEKEYEEGEVVLEKVEYDGIGKNILKLSKLKELNLSNNEIFEIPNYLLNNKTIEKLDLSFNNIEQISKEILQELKNLKYLNLLDNPIASVKGFPTSNNAKEVVEFLEQNQSKDLVPLNEAKILILGDENSGKSSLVERMVTNEFNEKYTSTRGIDIEQYTFLNGIKANIWDFAGQEITYQVHNLFMSKESLYILVIDGQLEDNQLDNIHWLETISSNSNDAPIIIAVTKHENNLAYKIDENLYKSQFKNLKHICYISSKENIGFDELKNNIEQVLEAIFTIQDKIPKNYLIIKEEIEKLNIEENIDILEPNEFDAICKKHNIKRKEKSNLRNILNNIGTIIGFGNDDMHIINPSWLLNMIYEIIRSKDTDEKGELKIEDIESLVTDENYEDRHINWIVKFLIENKIALKIDNETIMIPSILPVNPPNNFSKDNYKKVDKEYGLNFRYKYIRGFKKSILFEFIMQMEEYLVKEEPKYWANGVFLQYKDAKAVVLSSKIWESIYIHIPTKDKNAKKLLTIIRKKLDEIFDKSINIKIVKEIAIVNKNDNSLIYKNYKFLKYKFDQKKNRKVELDINSLPQEFELKNIVEKYEFIEKEPKNINKPIIFTEGKTDWKHLKKALERFQKDGEYKDLDIQFKEYEDEIDMGEDNLNHMLKANIKDSPSMRKIFIFDRDTKHKDIKKYQTVEFTKHTDKVYSVCIPKIDDLDGICIEFYYDEKALKTEDKNGRRLFLGKEFLKNGNSTCGKFVTEKRNAKPLDILDSDKKVYRKEDNEWNNNIALSKNDFAENILNDVDKFDDFDISNFKLIFDVIRKMLI